MYGDIAKLEKAVANNEDASKLFRTYSKHWGELKGFALSVQTGKRNLGEVAVKLNRLIGHGPLLLNADSLRDPSYNTTKIPVAQRNPYAWSKFANILAMDNTPPVGHSFCTAAGPAGNASSCGTWTDKTSCAANHKALA